MKRMASPYFQASLIALAFFAAICVSTPEDTAAYVVALLAGALTMMALSLVCRDPAERDTVVRLFLWAFLVRIAFTVVAYKAGLIDSLGGGDDREWINMWAMSRHWHGVAGYSYIPSSIPDNFWQIYNGAVKHNRGYHYFGSEFYYYLNVQSQMALSFVNCCLSSLTVVVVYKTGHDFFSKKAALWSAYLCMLMPGLIMWPALTIKETAVIFLQSVIFFSAWRFHRDRKAIYALTALTAIVLVLGFRYYIAPIGVAASAIALVAYRSRRPALAALLFMAALAGAFAFSLATHIVHIDVVGIVQSQLEEASNFSNSVATRHGHNSGVVLGYDVRTPSGLAKQVIVGSAYLLFSPFPWQGLSGRQIYALPDVLLWWGVFFFLVVPGSVALWRRRQALLVAVLAFVTPLILIYSIGFGNVGLAYRQRAQFIPLFLLLVGAGYEVWERRRARNRARHTGAISLARIPMPETP